MPLVNLTLCPGTWRSVPFIVLGWGCWCRCLCRLSSSECFSGSHLNAVQLPPPFWHSFLRAEGMLVPNINHYTDHIQGLHPQLCWGCSAARSVGNSLRVIVATILKICMSTVMATPWPGMWLSSKGYCWKSTCPDLACCSPAARTDFGAIGTG